MDISLPLMSPSRRLFILILGAAFTLSLLWLFRSQSSSGTATVNPSFAAMEQQSREWAEHYAGEFQPAFAHATELILCLGYVVYGGSNISPV